MFLYSSPKTFKEKRFSIWGSVFSCLFFLDSHQPKLGVVIREVLFKRTTLRVCCFNDESLRFCSVANSGCCCLGVCVWGVWSGKRKTRKTELGRQTRPQHVIPGLLLLSPILPPTHSLSPSRPETKVQIILKRACCGLHDTEDEKKTSKKNEIGKAENDGFRSRICPLS